MTVSQETKFAIHKASQAQATDIKRLILQSSLNPTALDWHRFHIAKDKAGNFIGCGQVKGHADGSMELASLAVKKAWRGQGVATALIERLLAEHPGELYLMCQSSLGAMYEKHDFHKIDEAEMPKYFRRISKLAGVLDNLRKQGESLLIMRRLGRSKKP